MTISKYRRLTFVASSTLVSTSTNRVSSGSMISSTLILFQSLAASFSSTLSLGATGGLLIRSCNENDGLRAAWPRFITGLAGCRISWRGECIGLLFAALRGGNDNLPGVEGELETADELLVSRPLMFLVVWFVNWRRLLPTSCSEPAAISCWTSSRTIW